MLSRKGEYALRALIRLAMEKDGPPVLIACLAARESIPKKFLEAILLELKHHGILESKKGRGGGYQLRKSPEEIRLGDVIRIIDGPLAPLPCVSRTAYVKCADCEDEKTCGVWIIMKEVRDAIADILDGTTLADVVRRVQADVRGQDVPQMYHI